MNYIKRLSLLNETAGALMRDYVAHNGFDDTISIIDFAFGLVTKYGEGSAALSAEMYDAIASLSGKTLPPAEVAPTATYDETAKAVQGTIKKSLNPNTSGATVSRLVKQAGADTMLKNAKRDGAQFAWVPMGDTCAFCLTLASRGWQYQSKKALKNGHAEHIHANCDCNYCVRFDRSSTVEGYDPQKYLDMYYGADGDTPQEKINSMRRMQYAENPEKYRAQKRATYNQKKETEKRVEKANTPNFYTGLNGKTILAEYKDWIGENQMSKLLNEVQSQEAIAYIRADFRKKSFIGDGSTAAIRKFEIETGLNCGRNGGNHAQKVSDLISQINKTLLKDIPQSDKIILSEMLKKLEDVQ